MVDVEFLEEMSSVVVKVRERGTTYATAAS